MKVSILVLENCTSIASIGAMELFRKANPVHQMVHEVNTPFFEVELISPSGEQVITSNGFPVICDRTIDELKQTDLLLVPALEFDIPEKLQANQQLIPHLVRLRKAGAEIGSMCTGSFLLAEAGLLEAQNATTHWTMAGLFRELYPSVELKDEKIVVDSNGIYCAGGATSFMNLVLYIVEKFCGKETATQFAKLLLLDFDKTVQTKYAIFNPQRHHSDDLIKRSQDIIEKRVHSKINLEALSREVGLSQRNFIRRFKKATGNNPKEYVQRVKIEAAKKKLEVSNQRIDEIAYSLAYNDMHTFRQLFKKITGMPPSSYRQKYNRFLTA